MSDYLTKLKNKVYKLLPLYEEGSDWKSYVETVIVEVLGANTIFKHATAGFIELACKLQGLVFIVEFPQYRKTIFESLALIEKIELSLSELN